MSEVLGAVLYVEQTRSEGREGLREGGREGGREG